MLEDLGALKEVHGVGFAVTKQHGGLVHLDHQMCYLSKEVLLLALGFLRVSFLF